MDESGEMDDVVVAVARSVQLVDGRALISDADLAGHADAVVAASKDGARADKIAEELVALAVRAAHEDSDGFDDVIVQLSVLAAIALGDVERAEAMLNVDDKTRAVVGATKALKPVGSAGRVDGASSPIAAVLANRTKKRGNP